MSIFMLIRTTLERNIGMHIDMEVGILIDIRVHVLLSRKEKYVVTYRHVRHVHRHTY